MRVLMLSGDRATTVGEKGPFYYLQEVFSEYWDRVDVLCPRPAAAPSVHSIHGTVHLHPAPCGRLRYGSYLRSKGAELMQAWKHDVIVSHDYGIYSHGRAAAELAHGGVPWISEIHHVPGVPRAGSFSERFDPWITARFVRYAVSRGAAAIRVVNRREMPRFLLSCRVPADRIRYISALYLDLDTFRPEAGVEARYDVAVVGRMVANKGFAVVIDALAAWKRTRPALRACFVGKGPLRDALRARAARAGLGDSITWIEWLDTKEDLARLYRRSRAVICASFNEGGPRFTCEAMACGTPCVTTPIGVMPDLVRDGENGWMFDFGAAPLVAALERALLDEPARARAASRCRAAVERFEKRSMIEKYARALQRVARREPATPEERVEAGA